MIDLDSLVRFPSRIVSDNLCIFVCLLLGVRDFLILRAFWFSFLLSHSAFFSPFYPNNDSPSSKASGRTCSVLSKLFVPLPLFLASYRCVYHALLLPMHNSHMPFVSNLAYNRELYWPLGQGTNNIGELCAILMALQTVSQELVSEFDIELVSVILSW